MVITTNSVQNKNQYRRFCAVDSVTATVNCSKKVRLYVFFLLESVVPYKVSV